MGRRGTRKGEVLTGVSFLPAFGEDFHVLGGQRRPARRWVGVERGGMVGKTTPAMHTPARKSNPKEWVLGGTRKEVLVAFRRFSEPFGDGHRGKRRCGQELR
jgi:hypothetical protein